MNSPTLTLAVETPRTEWADWKWQQRTAVRSVDDLLEVFPGLPDDVADAIRLNSVSRRFQITRYYLSLIRRTPDGDAPLPDDPLWRQVAPSWTAEGDSAYAYDAHTENWELAEEMVTPIAQHKYDNRIIVRLANVCHSYCQFCYEALRTLERESSKVSFHEAHWAATVEHVRANPAIEEVILSGGEPLMQADARLDSVLADLRAIERPLAIRIHTRALTFNPFRVTDDLVDVLRRYGVNAIGLHVTHPHEITTEFAAAVDRLHEATPILFTNTPLLRGVNDDVETIHELGMTLYLHGVVSQYLYHFMPHSPGSAQFRTSVQDGVDIVRALKRRITNLAVPEFVLPHESGKHSVPLLARGEAPPRGVVDDRGARYLRYTNWRGEAVDYPDA
jgi:lysine 2,3-aminomutase